MKRIYHRLWYRLDATNHFLIWFTNDQDGVVVDSSGVVPRFRDEQQLHTYARTHNLVLVAETPFLHNLDVVTYWLRASFSTPVTCQIFLAAWNLFRDLAVSVGEPFEVERAYTQRVYEKLFWGNNLPSVTPPGKKYLPVWSTSERLLLRKTLAHGLRLLRRYVV